MSGIWTGSRRRPPGPPGLPPWGSAWRERSGPAWPPPRRRWPRPPRQGCGWRGAGRSSRRLVVLEDGAARRSPASWLARVTIVWSTVSRSSVELSARPTSPSAVSCSTERVSSAVRARSSLNRRTFSIAITAWLAKVSRSAICLAEKGWASGPRLMKMTPSGVPSRSSGRAQHGPGEGAALPHAGHGFRKLSLGRHDVLDVDRPSVVHHPSADGATADGDAVSDRH